MSFERFNVLSFNALDVHGGSGIPQASPGVANPNLVAFFTIQGTQGANPGFSNLHVIA